MNNFFSTFQKMSAEVILEITEKLLKSYSSKIMQNIVLNNIGLYKGG